MTYNETGPQGQQPLEATNCRRRSERAPKVYRRAGPLRKNSRKIDVASLKNVARGRWPSILAALAGAPLAEPLAHPGQHVVCPVHGGKDGFRLFTDVAETGGAICNSCGKFGDGFALLGWLNHWTFPETLRAVAEYLGMAPDEAGAPRIENRTPPPTFALDPEKVRLELAEAERRRAAIARTWVEAKQLGYKDPVDRYLSGRWIDLSGRHIPYDVLRYHPGLYTKENGQLAGPFPAMVARIDGPDGKPVGLHRTFLTPDGQKAPLASAKKLMASPIPGATRGGAVRLYPAGPILAVAEGIETALAIRVSYCLQVWATVSAGGMEAVVIPACVKEVVICADNDESGRGQEAAHKLAQRMFEEGRKVRLAIPTVTGQDWADRLAAQKVEEQGRCRRAAA